jgi:opacity protein-like surface antigen
MKSVKWVVLFSSFSVFGQLIAQTTPLSLRTTIGLATYYGDLTEKAKVFNQSSLGFSIGLNYDITEQITGKLDFSIMKLKADDRFNTRTDFLTRNLNFTTTLWDIQLGAEYDFLNMVSEEYILTPYLGMGLGICHFNPWTYDRTGVKRYLREYGTEGQGLPSYPERKVYSNYSLYFPINFGIKYALNENVKLVFDLNFRKTFTDYLDDVGNTYPDQNIILNEAKDPTTTIGLTYRGDEVSTAPYPGVKINRGGYTNDFYYTTSIGLIIRLNNITIGGGGGAGGSSKRTGKIGSKKSRLRAPGRVF